MKVAQKRKARKTSKMRRKTETTQTFIQRMKVMKASKIKKSTEIGNSSKGENLVHIRKRI